MFIVIMRISCLLIITLLASFTFKATANTPADFKEPQRNLPELENGKSLGTSNPVLPKPMIYVDSQVGKDNSSGNTISTPLRTIAYALKTAQSGFTIQLAVGKYYSGSGEVFPLVIPSGVTLKGQEASKGQGVLIEGSGEYNSRTFGKQNITILGESDSQILGITVTNLQSRGTGIWVESASPIIRSSTFTNSLREGIFVTGNSAPIIENNIFTKNDANGITIVNNASGEIRANTFQQTGFGIAIGGNSSPLVEKNLIEQNRAGIVVSDRAKPTLKSNRIFNNQDNGLVVLPGAKPNIAGGSNMVQNNGKYDLYAPQEIINMANGNQIAKLGVLVISGQTQ